MKLYDALAYGDLEVNAEWRGSLTTAGHLVTDAKSLFDHVHGLSMLSTERQTSLDILGVQQMVQQQLLHLHLVPTWRQFADGLTKDTPDELFYQFRARGIINVKELLKTSRKKLEGPE